MSFSKEKWIIPDRVSLGYQLMDDQTIWYNAGHDMYLSQIKNPHQQKRAKEHYEDCQKHGLGYIGPEWHYKHYGRAMYTGNRSREEREADMEDHLQFLLFHMLAITVGDVFNFNVKTKGQTLLRERITEGFEVGLLRKAYQGYDSASCNFGSNIMEEDIEFAHFLPHTKYMQILLKMEEYYGCYMSDNKLEDQWMYDLYQVWLRYERTPFWYKLEHGSTY